MDLQFLIFIFVAIIIVIITFNITHWIHVIRYKCCKLGKVYSSTMKNDKTQIIVTNIKNDIIWFKMMYEDGTVTEEDFLTYDKFFQFVH